MDKLQKVRPDWVTRLMDLELENQEGESVKLYDLLNTANFKLMHDFIYELIKEKKK